MIRFREARMDTGRLIIDIPRDQIGEVLKFLRTKKDKDYSLEIKEYRKKRSNDANAKAWALMGEMSAILHIPPEEIYRGYIPDVGGNYWIMPVLPEKIEQASKEWCKNHIGRIAEDMGPCRSNDLAGYHNLRLYRGSSDYDTAQMNRLLELIIQDCRQMGIDALSEREKTLLLEEWDAK